jgi:GxxExxY protein
MNVVAADIIVVELKTVDSLLPFHVAQLLTYLKLYDRQLGLLLNFNVPVLKDGIPESAQN